MAKNTLLCDLRREWEETLQELMVLVRHETVYVVLQSILRRGKPTRYYLHRYFRVGSSWTIDVAVGANGSVESMDPVYKRLTKDFSDIYPQE